MYPLPMWLALGRQCHRWDHSEPYRETVNPGPVNWQKTAKNASFFASIAMRYGGKEVSLAVLHTVLRNMRVFVVVTLRICSSDFWRCALRIVRATRTETGQSEHVPLWLV